MELGEAVNIINLVLSRKFKHFDRAGRVYFILPDDSLLTLSPHVWNGQKLIIAEYADSIEEYKKGRFEDGDNYYLSDYTPVEIARKLIEEEM